MTQPTPRDHGREAHWLQENAEALESSNRCVERHGLPLQRFCTRDASRELQVNEHAQETLRPGAESADRVSLAALNRLSDAGIAAIGDRVPKVKTGRPVGR